MAVFIDNMAYSYFQIADVIENKHSEMCLKTVLVYAFIYFPIKFII